MFKLMAKLNKLNKFYFAHAVLGLIPHKPALIWKLCSFSSFSMSCLETQNPSVINLRGKETES